MYNMHLWLLTMKFWKKNHFLYIICIDILEFVAVEFILNLTFVQFLVFVSIKDNNLYSLYNVFKDKTYTVFWGKASTSSHENVTNSAKISSQ